jgi:glycosyltransferase involved in cell wall biosynthesis
MSKTVLMVAYHFPPFAGSSGLLRTLSFARHLPAYGWRPIVLTASVRAYQETNSNGLLEVPPDLDVQRAFALDVGRHLTVFGRYPNWMATPDRWNTWLLGAVPKGLSLVRLHRPQVLWTTYPIATCVLIGMVLRRATGIPWVLDLRDPLLYQAWPTEPWVRRVHGWLERHAVRLADKVILTTPGAARMYRDRYPALPADRWQVIPNGADEEVVAAVKQGESSASNSDSPVVLVHSGLLETPDRDPTAFLTAVAKLRQRANVARRNLRIVLRASGQVPYYQAKINALGLGDLIKLEPRVGYRDAIAELVSASGLLLFQGPDCNDQIPAKAYEYLAAGRPIFGLIHRDGDTCALLRECGVPYLADMNSPEEIARELQRFLGDVESGTAYVVAPEIAARYSRRARAQELARVLDGLGKRSG